MDDSQKRISPVNEAPLSEFKLEFEDPDPRPDQRTEALKLTGQEPARSPFASNANCQFPAKQPLVGSGTQLQKDTSPATAHPASSPRADEPRIIFYDTQAQKRAVLRQLMFCTVFGLIGALCFAGISAVYFSIGRRAGIFFVAFFAVLGTRMGAGDIRESAVRWYAAITAGAASVAGKGMLVLLLFQLYPDFTAEDWTNFAEPGKAAAIYLEQSVVNAFAAGGSDKRTGQERLNERFVADFQDLSHANSYPARYNKQGAAGGKDEEEPERLSYAQVFPKTFDNFDLGLMIITMILAFKFGKGED